MTGPAIIASVLPFLFGGRSFLQEGIPTLPLATDAWQLGYDAGS